MAITGDCKSPAVRLRRFESYFRHQIVISERASVDALLLTLLINNAIISSMLELIKRGLITWNEQKNQRLKLQQAYVALAIISLTVGGGLILISN